MGGPLSAFHVTLVRKYKKRKGEWVAKQDVGTTGYTEKEKSQASDSFKRACFNWRIGRELYSAPFIWVSAGKVAIQLKENKYCCYERFTVKSIEYNSDREISALVIGNDKDQIVYEMKAVYATDKNKGKAVQESSISKEQMSSLQSELNRTGITMETVQNRYKIQEPEIMSKEIYEKVMSALKRTKSLSVIATELDKKFYGVEFIHDDNANLSLEEYLKMVSFSNHGRRW